MIYLLGYVSTEQDVKTLREVADYVGAQHEDDDILDCNVTGNSSSFKKQFECKDSIDICCCDTSPATVLESVRGVRDKFSDMLLVLITDAETSPLTYIRPGIMPTSLLFKPLVQKAVHRAIDEVVTIASHANRKTTEGKYVLQTKQGKQIVDYSKILYFEALDKRIYLNTVNESYPFYSTLDNLGEELPQTFVRCHKSYIVNTENIVRVDFSENCIYTKSGITLPVSRSYRSTIKELKL